MDVIVVGSIVVDFISYTEEFPEVGQTVFGYDFQQGFGGKGANQLAMAAMLGASTGMVGRVGDDTFGQLYLQRLQQLGVNLDNVEKLNGSSTGTAIILVRKKDAANQIIVTPGANYLLCPEDVRKALPLFRAAKVLLCQLEIPLESTLESVRLANENGVLVVLNPAPAPSNPDTREQLVKALCNGGGLAVHVFCPNETEAALLLADSEQGVLTATITDVAVAMVALGRLMRLVGRSVGGAVRYVLITMGSLGVVGGDCDDGQCFHEPAPAGVVAVDTTGAGDCFAGSLAYFLASKPQLHIREQVCRSIVLASLSVQKRGTQASFPDRSALENRAWL